MTEESMPDIEPGPEWYRELELDRGPREPRYTEHPVAVRPRNGLPEDAAKPYAYRGTGEDQLLGTYGDKWLDQPRDW